MPLVSVIIPVYNGEKYLRECIDSVLSQTYNNIEVIVVDDGSTDNTPQIIADYGWEASRFVQIAQPNEGTASALNTGIDYSHGEWIRWIGADDVLLPDAIEVMMGRIEQLQQQGYDTKNAIFYTNYHIINENGDRLGDQIEPVTPPDIMERYYGSSSTAMFHESIFERCGLLDESLRSSEDYEFWLRCNKLHGVALKLIPVFTINYRKHDKQLTEATRGGNDPAIREKIRSQLTSR